MIKDSQKHETIDKTEVRIRTSYVGLSFTDRIIQQGLYKYQRQYMPLPYIPGFEASGTVAEVGEEVSDFIPGDKVVVLQRSNCLSSEIVVKAENVIKLPANIDLAWAASLPVNFFTASHALNNIVQIFPGSDLLVTSAAGGVGGMLTQLASRDHRVTGLVGKQNKKDYAQKLGACEVYTYEEFLHQSKKFDVILVASGKDLTKYIAKLNRNGKIIIYGFHSLVPRSIKSWFDVLRNYFALPTIKPFELVYENRTVSGFNIIHLNPESNEFRSVKKQFSSLVESDSMPVAHEVHEYKIEDINQALKDLAGGDVMGKIVVKF